MERLIKLLHGHSGCAISLWKGDKGYFVRKVSASQAYNIRLQKQAIKQMELANFGIRAPAVLRQSYNKKLYYFDMAYAPGIVADQAMLGDKQGLDRLAVFYCHVVEAFRQNVVGKLAASHFKEKISDVMAARSLLLAEPHISSRMARVAKWLAESDWHGIPNSPCHGDLTLENTIISESGEFTLIDCLDGPLTTFWLDVAKLYQDFTAHWFLREQSEIVINTSERSYAQLSAAYLGEAVRCRLEPKMPELFAKLNQLIGLQLFRIVPYCQSSSVMEYNLNHLEILMCKELRQ